MKFSNRFLMALVLCISTQVHASGVIYGYGVQMDSFRNFDGEPYERGSVSLCYRLEYTGSRTKAEKKLVESAVRLYKMKMQFSSKEVDCQKSRIQTIQNIILNQKCRLVDISGSFYERGGSGGSCLFWGSTINYEALSDQNGEYSIVQLENCNPVAAQ